MNTGSLCLIALCLTALIKLFILMEISTPVLSNMINNSLPFSPSPAPNSSQDTNSLKDTVFHLTVLTTALMYIHKCSVNLNLDQSRLSNKWVLSNIGIIFFLKLHIMITPHFCKKFDIKSATIKKWYTGR